MRGAGVTRLADTSSVSHTRYGVPTGRAHCPRCVCVSRFWSSTPGGPARTALTKGGRKDPAHRAHALTPPGAETGGPGHSPVAEADAPQTWPPPFPNSFELPTFEAPAPNTVVWGPRLPHMSLDTSHVAATPEQDFRTPSETRHRPHTGTYRRDVSQNVRNT